MRGQHARSHGKILVLALAMGLMLAGGSASAQAKSVTYVFSGALFDVPASLAGLFAVGDVFTGRYTVDLDAPGASLPGLGFYSDAATDFSISIAGYNASSPLASLNLADNLDFSQYTLISTTLTADAPWGPGIAPTTVILDLHDNSTFMLDGTTLPQTDDLNDSQFSTGTLQLYVNSDPLFGTIHTFAPVPTPTAALAGLGLLSALGLARGSRRASRRENAA